MSNATFSRKPLVAAVLTTLAVFSTGAMAADGEQEVRLTVGTGANTVPNTIKDEKTWDEDWAKTFNKDFTNASGKVTINGQNSDKITISKDEANKTAGKLTNKLSSLTLNVGLDVAEGGTFVNNGTLEANKAITVTGSLVNTDTLKTNETLTIKGGFDNAKGKIEATKDVTINGLDKTTDLEAAPASVVMGDITLTNATLTNNDKGYKLKTEADKKEGEDDKKPETRARVSYGNVTLKTGGKFVNAESALDSGSSLTIASLPRLVPKAMPTRNSRVLGMSPSSAPSRSTTTPRSRFPATRLIRLTTSQNMATRPPCRSAASHSIRRPSR